MGNALLLVLLRDSFSLPLQVWPCESSRTILNTSAQLFFRTRAQQTLLVTASLELRRFSPAVVCESMPCAAAEVPRLVDFLPATSVVVALTDTSRGKHDQPLPADSLDRATQGQLIHAMQSGLLLENGARVCNPGLLCLEALVVRAHPCNSVVKCGRNTTITFANSEARGVTKALTRSKTEARFKSNCARPRAARKLRAAVFLPFVHKHESYMLGKQSGSRVVSYNGVLVYGPPGVGKTYAIHELICELKETVVARLFTYDHSSEESEEEALRRTLRSARSFVKSNDSCFAVVLLEDIDRICPEKG